MAIMWFMKEIWGLMAAAVVITITRVVVRGIMTKRIRSFEVDDWLSIIACCIFVLCVAFTHMTTIYGINFDFRSNELAAKNPAMAESFSTGSKYNFGVWLTYISHLWFLKVAMLFFFRRVAQNTTLMQPKKFYCYVAFLVGTGFIAIIQLFFQCRPLAKFWQVVPQPGQCMQNTSIYLIVGILNIITDFFLLTIPIPFLRQTNFALKRKILLGVLFCGGIIIVIVTTFRLIWSVIKVGEYQRNPLGEPDQSGFTLQFGFREMLVATLVVNAPVIAPMFYHKFWTMHVRSVKPTYVHDYGSNGSTNKKNTQRSHKMETYNSTYGGGTIDIEKQTTIRVDSRPIGDSSRSPSKTSLEKDKASF